MKLVPVYYNAIFLISIDGDLQSLLNTMSQQQLMQFFGNVGQIGNLSSLLGPSGAGGRPSASSRSSAASGATTTASSAAPAADQAAKSETKTSEQQPKDTNGKLNDISCHFVSFCNDY